MKIITIVIILLIIQSNVFCSPKSETEIGISPTVLTFMGLINRDGTYSGMVNGEFPINDKISNDIELAFASRAGNGFMAVGWRQKSFSTRDKTGFYMGPCVYYIIEMSGPSLLKSKYLQVGESIGIKLKMSDNIFVSFGIGGGFGILNQGKDFYFGFEPSVELFKITFRM